MPAKAKAIIKAIITAQTPEREKVSPSNVPKIFKRITKTDAIMLKMFRLLLSNKNKAARGATASGRIASPKIKAAIPVMIDRIKRRMGTRLSLQD